jgi:hypothetical protein
MTPSTLPSRLPSILGVSPAGSQAATAVGPMPSGGFLDLLNAQVPALAPASAPVVIEGDAGPQGKVGEPAVAIHLATPALILIGEPVPAAVGAIPVPVMSLRLPADRSTVLKQPERRIADPSSETLPSMGASLNPDVMLESVGDISGFGISLATTPSEPSVEGTSSASAEEASDTELEASSAEETHSSILPIAILPTQMPPLPVVFSLDSQPMRFEPESAPNVGGGISGERVAETDVVESRPGIAVVGGSVRSPWAAAFDVAGPGPVNPGPEGESLTVQYPLGSEITETRGLESIPEATGANTAGVLAVSDAVFVPRGTERNSAQPTPQAVPRPNRYSLGSEITETRGLESIPEVRETRTSVTTAVSDAVFVPRGTARNPDQLSPRTAGTNQEVAASVSVPAEWMSQRIAPSSVQGTLPADSGSDPSTRTSTDRGAAAGHSEQLSPPTPWALAEGSASKFAETALRDSQRNVGPDTSSAPASPTEGSIAFPRPDAETRIRRGSDARPSFKTTRVSPLDAVRMASEMDPRIPQAWVAPIGSPSGGFEVISPDPLFAPESMQGFASPGRSISKNAAIGAAGAALRQRYLSEEVVAGGPLQEAGSNPIPGPSPRGHDMDPPSLIQARGKTDADAAPAIPTPERAPDAGAVSESGIGSKASGPVEASKGRSDAGTGQRRRSSDRSRIEVPSRDISPSAETGVAETSTVRNPSVGSITPGSSKSKAAETFGVLADAERSEHPTHASSAHDPTSVFRTELPGIGQHAREISEAPVTDAREASNAHAPRLDRWSTGSETRKMEFETLGQGRLQLTIAQMGDTMRIDAVEVGSALSGTDAAWQDLQRRLESSGIVLGPLNSESASPGSQERNPADAQRHASCYGADVNSSRDPGDSGASSKRSYPSARGEVAEALEIQATREEIPAGRSGPRGGEGREWWA